MEAIESDVVFAQETHCNKEQDAMTRGYAKKSGWKMISSPAVPIVGKGTSGGVAVAVRSRYGLGFALGEASGTVVGWARARRAYMAPAPGAAARGGALSRLQCLCLRLCAHGQNKKSSGAELHSSCLAHTLIRR